MNNDDLEHLDDASAPRIRPDIAAAADRRGERSYGNGAVPGSESPLVDYVRAVYKRRWTAGTVFLVVLGTVAAYTFTTTPIYEAKTRLLIESDDRNVVAFQQVVEEREGRPDYYQTQFNILQSRALARKTMDDLGLWRHPAFAQAPGPEQADSGLWATITSLFSSPVGGEVDENVVPAPDETLAQSRAIDAFLGGLTVSPVRNSRLVDINYRSPDAQLATRAANALARNYMLQNLEYKFMASQEASDWLGERLAEQRKAVEDAELALQNYREQNDAISLGDNENIVVQKLADLNAAVTRAKTQRIEKEALYNQLRISQSNPAALDTFPAILANGFIQQQKAEVARLQREQAQLAEKLGDKHPEMQRLSVALEISQSRLTGEIAKVVQAVRSEYQTALAQENDLTVALSQQKSEALAMNRKAINYTVLQRDVDSSRQIYDSLMQRAKETGVAGELRTSNIRVVDEAEVPRGPVSPNTRRNLLMAFLGGLMLACALVFFLEYVDSRIKTPDEIQKHLGLPSLGMLPKISAKAGAAEYPLISNGVPANFGEAFRALRTNVLFSSAHDGSKSIVVTSTGPGEGKSMVAANMAVGLAQSGQRVLLIDADLRKPKVHEVMRLPQEPGLSNLLVGQAKASEVVRKTAVPGLWVLPAGRTPPNPAELVGSTRFREFIASVKGHFDWVLIDSPPVMAVTDASLIAHHVTGVLFVVGAEMTSWHTASRALDQLERVQARFVGAVLNRVDLERNPYYYLHYSRPEYADYYAKSS